MNQSYLEETHFINFNHPTIRNLAAQVSGKSNREKAISCYYLVRDTIRYNPYTVQSGIESFKASFATENKQAYCIPKATLMVALCRYHKIPARLGLADVRNHLSSKKFIELIGTDYFAMHGYAEIFLAGKWLKTTPIFNRELCQKFEVEPLEFNGVEDAIFQNYTKNGERHMEYIIDHGHFSDVPVDFILASYKKHYPDLEKIFCDFDGHSIEQDLAQ